MKYLNLTKNLAIVAILSLLFTACKKANVATPLGDKGQILVKLLGGSTPYAVAKKPIDFLPTPTTLVAVEVRRDLPNETELNKTMIVTLRDDTAAVSFFNRDTVSSNPSRTNPGKLFYNQFPPSWFTTTIDGGVKAGGQGGTWTITFKPGEFSKTVYLTIPNATLLNPSALYAVAFTVLTADAGAKLSTQKSIIVEIGAKNAYDGIYSIESGNVQRYTAGVSDGPGGLNGPLAGNPDIYLITTGAFQLAIPPVSTTGGLFWAFGANSMVAGVDGIRVNVDPSTNLTTSSSLGNATFANWAGFTNNYVPATKTFNLAFRWNPTGNTREYVMVLKYKAPR